MKIAMNNWRRPCMQIMDAFNNAIAL